MGRSCGGAAASRRCRAVRVGPGEHAPSDPDGSILDRTPSPRGRACRLVMPSVAYTTTPSIGTGLDKAAVGVHTAAGSAGGRPVTSTAEALVRLAQLRVPPRVRP